MKKYLLASSVLLALAAPTHAQVIEDPLHGECTNLCGEQTIGGQQVTPIQSTSGFGFSVSPAPATGNLLLEFLIPNSYTAAQVGAFLGGVSVTNNGSSFVLSSHGIWNSGTLTGFLGYNTSPTNPLDAWLPATKTLQPTATGYYVLEANTGAHTLSGPNVALTVANTFSLNPGNIFADGAIITGFIDQASFGVHNYISTAQSGGLFYNGPQGTPFCTNCTPDPQAVPGPVVGAGLPGLFAACMFLVGLAKRRRNRQNFGVA